MILACDLDFGATAQVVSLLAGTCIKAFGRRLCGQDPTCNECDDNTGYGGSISFAACEICGLRVVSGVGG